MNFLYPICNLGEDRRIYQVIGLLRNDYRLRPISDNAIFAGSLDAPEAMPAGACEDIGGVGFITYCLR